MEAGESTDAALKRELFEELDIAINDSQPLIQIHHDYKDKSIFLDVFRVKNFTGTAKGNEGQEIRWVNRSQLSDFTFPAANKAIIDAAQLPNEYLITPEHHLSERTAFLQKLETKFAAGISLIQLRAKTISDEEFAALYHQVREVSDLYNVTIQVNTSIKNAIKLNTRCIHLTSRRLKTAALPAHFSVSASCHNENDIQLACEAGVRFIVLSPVCPTSSHPNATPLGWEAFSRLCKKSTVPVFALGGMKKTDVIIAGKHGAQGIAAISSLWS